MAPKGLSPIREGHCQVGQALGNLFLSVPGQMAAVSRLRTSRCEILYQSALLDSRFSVPVHLKSSKHAAVRLVVSGSRAIVCFILTALLSGMLTCHCASLAVRGALCVCVLGAGRNLSTHHVRSIQVVGLIIRCLGTGVSGVFEPGCWEQE